MSIFEFRGGPVTRRSLDKKSKHDVISDALMAMDHCDRLRTQLDQERQRREQAEGLLREAAGKLEEMPLRDPEVNPLGERIDKHLGEWDG